MEYKNQIYIPIFSNSVRGKSFALERQNPGCGGTQFLSIKLGLMLAHTYPDYQVTLVNESEIMLESPPENLVQLKVASFKEFLQSRNLSSARDILIVPEALLRKNDPSFLAYHRQKTICWVHHPFSYNMSIRNLGLAAYVCVGTYQYYSNKSFYRPLWHIQNIFQLPHKESVSIQRPTEGVGGTIRIVYLGALIPAKGFLHIARQWDRIKRFNPNTELHVIGSSATYGLLPESKKVPTDSRFASQILKYIPVKDIASGKVVFHGNVGDEKFEIMRRCHAAILNPTGSSEAFPASTLECMAAGLPVIASDDYGMSDSMRFFPELSLSSPAQIPEKLAYLLSDANRFVELQQRALAVAKWFDGQNAQTMIRWRRLIEKLGSNERIADEGPIFGLHGSKTKMMKRKTRGWLGVLKRRSFAALTR